MQVGDVLLPPEILLHLWSEGRQEVVGVHDDVHKGVDPANEGAVAARIVLGGAPADHGHDCVMIDVQECHLAIVLTQHKEDRVQQLGDLGQIVDVDDACLAVRLGRTRPIDRLTAPAVILPNDHALVHHPDAERHLEEVVDEQRALQLEGFAVAHKARTPRQHKVQIEAQNR